MGNVALDDDGAIVATLKAMFACLLVDGAVVPGLCLGDGWEFDNADAFYSGSLDNFAGPKRVRSFAL